MAEEDHDCGYRRIQGTWSNLGHEIARGTIANILQGGIGAGRTPNEGNLEVVFAA